MSKHWAIRVYVNIFNIKGKSKGETIIKFFYVKKLYSIRNISIKITRH